jgi:hypothetical protein
MAKSVQSRLPRPDRCDAAVLGFVEALLDDFFMDPGNEKTFERLIDGGRKAGAKAGETVSLLSIELADDGEVDLNQCVGSPDLLMAITHPRFSAKIAARYDVATATALDARIVSITGDREKARKLAGKWSEDIAMFDFDDDADIVNDALAALLSDEASPFDDQTDPGEPPPASSEDKAMVDVLASALAREMRRKNPDMLSHQDSLLGLEQCPQTLWPILSGMVEACTAGKRDDSLIDAWRFLLESQLTLIRYRIDRGWTWAARMAEEYQRKLIEIGHEGRLSTEDFAAMAGALSEAGIGLKPEARRALAEAGLNPAAEEGSLGLQNVMAGLMDQMASTVSDPFEVVDALGQATKVLPSEMRCFVAHEFARSSHKLLRDSVPLMLLSQEQDVRQAAAAALRETADPDTMSPETLRRMIAIRGWVPEPDREAVDQAIRRARTKGVDCAPWPAVQDLMVTASTIDGSGAQSIFLTSRGKRKGVLAGTLLKPGVGVADSWCDTEAARRDINDTLTAMQRAGLANEVERSYFDEAVQHAIAVGANSGRPPDSAVLQIAELFDGAGWRGRRLDVSAEAERLFDALPPDHRSAAAVEASLGRSGEWLEEEFAESWFLDDADIRAIVKRAPRRDTSAAVQRLLAEAMPQRRQEWAERFLLLALWSQAATDRSQRARANDFIILAHSLCDDRDPTTIPLMIAIAKHTVEVARIARW